MAKKTNDKLKKNPVAKSETVVSEAPTITELASPLPLTETDDLFIELAYRIKEAGQMGALAHLSAANHAFKR